MSSRAAGSRPRRAAASGSFPQACCAVQTGRNRSRPARGHSGEEAGDSEVAFRVLFVSALPRLADLLTSEPTEEFSKTFLAFLSTQPTMVPGRERSHAPSNDTFASFHASEIAGWGRNVPEARFPSRDSDRADRLPRGWPHAPGLTVQACGVPAWDPAPQLLVRSSGDRTKPLRLFSHFAETGRGGRLTRGRVRV